MALALQSLEYFTCETYRRDNQVFPSVHNSESPIPDKNRKRNFTGGFSGSNGEFGEEKNYGLYQFIVMK